MVCSLFVRVNQGRLGQGMLSAHRPAPASRLSGSHPHSLGWRADQLDAMACGAASTTASISTPTAKSRSTVLLAMMVEVRPTIRHSGAAAPDDFPRTAAWMPRGARYGSVAPAVFSCIRRRPRDNADD